MHRFQLAAPPPPPTLQDDVNPACIQDLGSRRDAWDEVWPLSECESRGFCWSAAPRHLPHIPWCYHRRVIEGQASAEMCAASAAGSRRDCAIGGGVTPRSCAEKGCCWVPSSASGEPWCFYAAGDGYDEDTATQTTTDEENYDEGDSAEERGL